MIRPAIRPIVIASLASGIAAKAMEEPDISWEDRMLFKRLLRASETLIEKWPVRIRSDRELAEIGTHLDAFLERTRWDERPRHIQTYVHFIAYLLEEVLVSVREPSRRRLIDAILNTATVLYRRFSSGKDREYEWCLQSGIRAAQLWEDIMLGSNA